MQFNQTALYVDAAATGQGIALAPLLRSAESRASSSNWRDTQSDQNGFYVIWPDARSQIRKDTLIDWVLSEVGHDRG